MIAEPVLKWAGGKRQLLPAILARLPQKIETYFEPFVGGGAVFFALAAERRFRHAVLSDRNPDLVEVYLALQSEVGEVIERLKRLRAKHSEQEYYRVRAAKPRGRAGRAARFIYLNRTGFNGLYRVNRSGQFNVPFGKYVNPTILDEPRLLAAAACLRDVEISAADFAVSCARARGRDAVYLDPPYLPRSASSSFSAYYAEPFGVEQHARLARTFAELSERGVATLLSNSDTPETRGLFRAHRVETVAARRSINSVGGARGAISEILVSAMGPRAEGQSVARRAAS
jgi:DNA adenine methylase